MQKNIFVLALISAYASAAFDAAFGEAAPDAFAASKLAENKQTAAGPKVATDGATKVENYTASVSTAWNLDRDDNKKETELEMFMSMIVTVDGTDGIGAETVDNAICIEDFTGQNPKALACVITQYAALDADTYQMIVNDWEFDSLTYPKDDGLNLGINEWKSFEGCGDSTNACRDKQKSKVDYRQDRSVASNTTAQRMKVLKGESQMDMIRVGIADNKTMTTTVRPEKLEAKDDEADAKKVLDDFKAGKFSLSGQQYLTVTYLKDSSPKTLTESLPFKTTFNEPAKDPAGDGDKEKDAATASFAFAFGALSVALSTLAF